jgi:UDP-N-acetyl-2-amino-2-deoxyglucuronate dehydrogenase
MKRFAMTGVAGFVAPRHLRAIRDTGNTLIAGLDPHDSVGLLDSYFPEAHFFTSFERFERHLEKQRFQSDGEPIDYLSAWHFMWVQMQSARNLWSSTRGIFNRYRN